MSLDSRTGVVKWSVRTQSPPEPIPAGDTVFAVADAIYALDAATGRTKWITAISEQSFLFVT